MTPSLGLCPNCGKPAPYVHLYKDGHKTLTCGNCVTGYPVGVRGVGDADVPTRVVPPLTVAEAAKRENVALRTVYRWLGTGQLGDGAWKVGATWRIDADALDARRVQGPKPRKREPAKVPTPARRRATKTTDEDWPT